MKILIVTDYFYPHWTGISKSLYYLIKTKVRNITFDVLTTKYNSDLKSKERIFQTTIYREPYIFSVSRVKYSFAVIFRFISLAHNYDGILINSPCSNMLPISLLSKLLNKKLFIFHQGDLILPKGLKNKLLEIIFDLSSQISFYVSNKISTYSRDYAIHSRIMKSFLNKFTPLLMPVYIDKKSIDKNNAIYKKLSNLKKQKKILFGFAGRFVEEKGFDILLNAIPETIIKNSNIHFVFAGDTKIVYENFYEKSQSKISLIKEHLTMLGLLNETDLQNFYYQIDYIIIPSRSDCFNLVQAEAMLFGKPSIVSDIPGASFLVKKTGYGRIFENNNTEDLARQILKLSQSKKPMEEAYKKVIQLLDDTRIITQLSGFFQSFLLEKTATGNKDKNKKYDETTSKTQ